MFLRINFALGNVLVKYMDFFQIYNTPGQKTPWKWVVPGNFPHLLEKSWNYDKYAIKTTTSQNVPWEVTPCEKSSCSIIILWIVERLI